MHPDTRVLAWKSAQPALGADQLRLALKAFDEAWEEKDAERKRERFEAEQEAKKARPILLYRIGPKISGRRPNRAEHS